MNRMMKYGLLEQTEDKLDYVLALKPQDMLERRLQTLVFKLAESIHHSQNGPRAPGCHSSRRKPGREGRS